MDKRLLYNATTCIKTNGFVSKYFSITRSARQECPIAPFLSIIQAEPMARAIRGNTKVEGLKLPDEGGNFKETKLCMFADDTQVFNKNEKSVENTFKILSLYEKASGSRINHDKTNGLLLGTSKRNRFKFDKIKWQC